MSGRTPPRPGPEGWSRRVAQMLRVDHAGELGAVHIYRGQQAVLAGSPRHAALAERLAEMESHEARHLARLDALLIERRARPSLLAPVWRAAGFTLGATTALIGARAAHACTEAVETVIEGHYGRQIDELAGREEPLAAELAGFRDEEIAHREEAVAGGAREAPAYGLLSGLIRGGCRAAIRLAETL